MSLDNWQYTPMKTHTQNGITIEYPSSYNDVNEYHSALLASLEIIKNSDDPLVQRQSAGTKKEIFRVESALAIKKAA